VKVSQRQLKRIIREERSRLLSEQLTDSTDWQDLLVGIATEISNKFGEDMTILYDEDPEAFQGRSTRESWEEQIDAAQIDIDTALVTAMEKVLADIEARLHGGDYSDDPGGPTTQEDRHGRGYPGT